MTLQERLRSSEPAGPIYCVGNKTSHAYFWRRSDAEAFAASAGAAVGLQVWKVHVMGKPLAADRIDALEGEIAALRDVLGKARREVEYVASGMAHAAWKTDQARETLAAIDAAMAQKVDAG